MLFLRQKGLIPYKNNTACKTAVSVIAPIALIFAVVVEPCNGRGLAARSPVPCPFLCCACNNHIV